MRLFEAAREDGVITLEELTSMITELIEVAGLEGQVILELDKPEPEGLSA